MTTDGQHLLAAIHADPEADDPRLQYADWLDETDPGERVTCEKCKGTRWHTTRTRAAEMDADEYGTSTYACPACDGTGTVRDERQARRAELIRLQCRAADLKRDGHGPGCNRVNNVNRKPRAGGQGWLACSKCLDLQCDEDRSGELLAARGAEWSRVACPACKGNGWSDGHRRDLPEPEYRCDECDGTGDAMHARNPQWSRGFVTQVECRLEEVGGEAECEECERISRDYPFHMQSELLAKCPACKGTGRVFRPAPWLAAVVRAHPLDWVSLRDVNPLEVNNHSPNCWTFLPDDDPDPESGRIPEWLYEEMRVFYHPTADAARDALARAVADVVRQAANGTAGPG